MVQLAQLMALVLVGRVPALVATVSQYFLAPLTVDQLKVGVAETPVDPFVGCESVGGDSRFCAVVKEAMPDQFP